jgi:phosphatidylglycerophosphatase A
MTTSPESRPPQPTAATEASGARRPRPVGRPAFRLSRPSHLIALGAGSGLAPRAPGTVGTLWAWAIFAAADGLLDRNGWLLIAALGFLLGVWACGRVGKDIGVADHPAIVWDEVIAFWLVLTLIPDGLAVQVVAFLLFRFFDIVKPPPIRQFDARLKGGFGVMFDDLLAAAFTLIPILIWESL